MVRPAFIPLHVDALPVEGGVPVPAPSGDERRPFSDDELLAPGVHLHWALPDGLTRGVHEHPDDAFIRFPAVPDLWVIVRWNPPGDTRKAPPQRPSGSNIFLAFGLEVEARRSYRAWVQEARTGKIVPLESWSPPSDVESRPRLTAVGELDEGKLPVKSSSEPVQNRLFDAAYYPTSRFRFGFHDPLTDVASGPLSYTVVGWYSRKEEDPLFAAGGDSARHAFACARQWDIPWVCRAPVQLPLQEGPGETIELPSLVMKELPQGDSPLISRKPLEVGGLAETQQRLIRGLGRDIQAVPGTLSDPAESACHPDRIYCHGAVLDVLWRGGGGSLQGRADKGPTPELQVSSSLFAAAADGFANGGLEDVIQALELDLGGELESTAARQGLAHKLHASRFVSTAGGSLTAFFVEPSGGMSAASAASRLGFSPSQSMALLALPKDATAVYIRDRGLRTQLAEALAPGKPKAQQVFLRRTRFSGEEARTLLDIPALQGQVLVFRGALPRPRVYRPAAPVVVLTGCGRAWRYGQDGRLDGSRFDEGSTGMLACRDGYGTITGVSISLPDVPAAPSVAVGDLSANGPALAGLPAPVGSLIRESALLDPTNAPQLAGLWLARAGLSGQDYEDQLEAATEAFQVEAELWWGLADVEAGSELEAELLESTRYEGVLPSPLAITPWRKPWAPLFAEYRWAFFPRAAGSAGGFAGLWRLGEVDWEPVSSEAAIEENKVVGEARALLTVAVADLLVQASAARPRAGTDAIPVPQASPVAAARTDLLTFNLSPLEALLKQAQLATCAGWLRLEALRIVDVFGQTRALLGDDATPGTVVERRPKEELPWLTGLSEQSPAHLLLRPGIPDWSRVLLELGPFGDHAGAAVRGYLLPDLLEHGIEVFDRDGNGLGQLTQKRSAEGTSPVCWEAHPWAEVLHPELEPADPGRVIGESSVLGVVRGLLEQPAGPDGESALSALLRLMDTTRLSIQRQPGRAGGAGLMTGRPVVLVAATLGLETGVPGSAQGEDSGGSPKPEGLVARLGSLTQLDDGLLGYFVNQDFQQVRPVAAGLRESALTGGPYSGFQGDSEQAGVQPITHPYVAEDALLPLNPNAPVDLLLLLEPYSAVHVTTGILPRKKITVPDEALEALERLAASFRVGPVLTPAERAVMPLPEVAQRAWEWVEQEGESSVAMPAERASAQAAVAATPVRLREGWLRQISSDLGG